MAALEVIAYSVGVSVVVVFGIIACLIAFLRERNQGHADSPEFFLTARKSIGTFTIAWSFYAGAMGSWALFGPASYCLFAGVLGTVMYAVAAGFPIMVVAYFGGVIQDLVPNVMGLSDYINRRFGRALSLYVGLLTLFNMGVALTAEYTAVGDLYEIVIQSTRWPIVVIIGVVAMIYTAAGGLYVSIITDQFQALVSVVVVAILFIYVAITFDRDLGPLPNSYLGYYDLTLSNYYGLASIGVMPISLVSATFYSEAVWQRCWAAADRRTLMWGAFFGALAVSTVVFLLGFAGILAVWGGVWVPASESDFGNTILFSLLGNTTWILVVVSILAVTMTESAVDSLQNAIVDSISTAFVSPLVAFLSPGSKISLWWIRALVLVLNVPPIVVSLKGYNILQLFLLANLVTTTSTLPIVLGVLRGRVVQKWVTPFSSFAGCMVGLSSLFWWAKIKQDNGMSYSDALHFVFLESFDYPPFLLALGFSIVGMLLGAGLEAAFRMMVPGAREYPFYDVTATKDIFALVPDAEPSFVAEGKFEGKDEESLGGLNDQHGEGEAEANGTGLRDPD